jgi:hypothetical protein
VEFDGQEAVKIDRCTKVRTFMSGETPLDCRRESNVSITSLKIMKIMRQKIMRQTGLVLLGDSF